MKRLILYIVPLVGLYACDNFNKSNISARTLNDSAISITKQYKDTSKFIEAIALLDQAIHKDSTNFEYYKNKYFFEASLGNSKSALNTIGHLLKFKPDSADLHFQAGILQQLYQDTIQAKISFQKATTLYKATLNTMDKKSPYWFYDWRLWAVSMIMINQDKVIHDFLKENCTTPIDSSIYHIELLSKSKEEILKLLEQQYSR